MNKVIFFFLILLANCSNVKEQAIEITVEYSQSYKFNLSERIYTIFYLSKPPTEIKFHLTDVEKRNLIELYYKLEMEKIKGETKIIDKCMLMPKFFTTLHIKTKNELQKIIIDEECNTFYPSDARKAKKIKKFLKEFSDIVRSKSEIRNAPKSDIFYL